MKLIPRIGGACWPVFLVLLMLMIIPPGAFAQEGDPGTEEEPPVAAAEDPDAGDEGDATLAPDDSDLGEESAESDEEPAMDEEGDDIEVSGQPVETEIVTEQKYNYQVYHSESGNDGTWELIDEFPVNTQYVWEQPQYMGFFLTEPDADDEDASTGYDHFSVFENTYPATGIYSYSIETMEEEPDGEEQPAAEESQEEEPVEEEAVGEVVDPWADFEYDFVAPENVEFYDRPSDEGGAIVIRWSPSPSDTATVDIEVPVAVEEPAAEEEEDEDEAGEEAEEITEITILVSANFYDPDITDYSEVEIFCNLRPLGGERIQLEYVPPPEGADLPPWANTFENTAVLQTDGLNINTPSYILFTSPGQTKRALGAQPALDTNQNKVVNGSDGEQPVPDNRDPHWLKLFAVPAGYTVSDPGGLPPSEWMLGSVNEFVASYNIMNDGRLNLVLFALLICAGVLTYIYLARGGAKLFVRRIAGLDHVEEAIGRATEMGRPILYSTGLGGMSDIATIASVNILGRVARKVADYESRLMVPSRDPIVMAVCQEVVQEAYIDSGRPDAYNKDDVFFITDDQFAYTAAVDGIMVREKPATNFFMGMFFAESLLLAETGASTGAIQIAGTDALAQLPFFITACDYTLIGEELYAASAYLSHEPLLLGSLKGQDFAKLVLMTALLIGTIVICLNADWNFIQLLFRTF